ncbi:exported zinc metalloprotease YfgC precursor [Halomonas beimenensis]|uniref:Putative beta-barrel assembly-enhancing protease n=4 Tax=Halomonas beimenensis TaxID=475662 RepID=A0A291P448_9GAMM|nr:M48 family metalloprotease [Halomonas beimenensis]ATJ81649.1 exported zinc metalloprotease YfgC precursor [Halomonas beimenensis]
MLRRLLPCLPALALSLALAVPALGQSETPDLPSLIAGDTQAVSGEEVRLGRAWLRQFRAQAPLWQDPIAQDYLESLVARLLPHSQLGGIDPVITLVASERLNAFAVPGGVIGVNAGLFAFAEGEAPLASVIAHELGHLSQRHYARGKERAEQARIPAMAAMLAGMLIAAGGGGDAGIAAAMGSQAALFQDQLAYSRRFEREADRLGLQTLADAGYDPQAMVEMFRTMQHMVALQGGTPPEFLLTHPVTESRISDAQARADQVRVTTPRENDIEYQLVRARALLAIHDQEPRQAATRLARGGASESARRYLAALIDADGGRTDAALAALDALSASLPDLALVPVSAAQVALDAGRIDAAIERARRQLRMIPDYAPARLVLGEALLQRDPEEAYRVLRDLAGRRPEDPQVFTLLAEAAGRSGREAWGHLARAEHLQLTGHIDRAIRQLEVAEQVAEAQGDANAAGRIAQRREAFLGYRETLEEFE